ncbi:conserved Plasmodium protein, unknown function [Plasmodium malariae]|uniref:HIT-type domain-containing protein n=1 Tax=Plasmodium malariae TaxID=5858 RepID=A0A1C3KBK8_PLAMA|nr:conserved Plasmodium protein, unknown function [Plasmodium malariae]
MDDYECNYRYDLENYNSNFGENIMCYNESNYVNGNREYNNFENDFCFFGDTIEEDSKEEKDCEYINTKSNQNNLKISKELSISLNNNSSNFKKRKVINDSSHKGNKKLKKNDLCIVCMQNERKYKFTCCYEYYCSVPCFNKHNQKECLDQRRKKLCMLQVESMNGDSPSTPTATLAATTYSNNDNFFFSYYEQNEKSSCPDYIQSECLTNEQKHKLKEDLALKLLLKNNYVRSVFKQFSLSNDKISYLSHYINDPTVVQVIDQIMKTIES